MTDSNLIVFPENQNLGIDTKVVFLGWLVPKLLDILYFGKYGNLCYLW